MANLDFRVARAHGLGCAAKKLANISQIDENNYLMIKCEKLNSPLVVVNAVPVTEELLKQKLTL